MSLPSDLQSALAAQPLDLAEAALVIARIEYPQLDRRKYRAALDRLGDQAGARLARIPAAAPGARVEALNRLLFEDEGFAGNRARYDDVRNSCLNEVIDRRLGIPITLALVYMEVARRAGFAVEGVSFPGHFLMRVTDEGDLVLDPFAGGAALSMADCRQLLATHVDPADDHPPFESALLRPCTPRHLLARMLNNLKRTYLELRSFPQARQVADLLLTVDPTRLTELRDRGLLAYHLEDVPAALRDLEDYLRLQSWPDESDREERDQIWEHVKTLKRRQAGMN